MGNLASGIATVSKIFICPNPEALVSGLLIINVKHSNLGESSTDSGETDCNMAYAENWGSNPSDVVTSGNTPYYNDATPPKYPNATEFDQYSIGRDGRYFLANSDTSLPKTLSSGDYDCFLFYVTCCAHLEEKKEYLVPDGSGGWIPQYHHEACQSFIKSHLISRINNASDSTVAGVAEGAVDGTSLYKRGIYRRHDTITDTSDTPLYDVQQRAVNHNAESVFSNGDYVDQMLINGEVDEDLPSFGINLGDGNNTFMNPVESIQIGIHHPEPDPLSGLNHTHASYGLLIRIHLWAIEGATPEDDESFYRNRVNVLWQPFGEASDFEDP
jgi:hypothetical protein